MSFIFEWIDSNADPAVRYETRKKEHKQLVYKLGRIQKNKRSTPSEFLGTSLKLMEVLLKSEILITLDSGLRSLCCQSVRLAFEAYYYSGEKENFLRQHALQMAEKLVHKLDVPKYRAWLLTMAEGQDKKVL